VDPLGFYLPPYAYGYMQVLQQAVEGTKSLDQAKLADYLRTHTFKTIVGDIKFGPNGEWAVPKVLEVQWQNVKGTDVAQFNDPKTEAVLWPGKEKSGNINYPYTGK
jgi:branched-chain amino acid transport system substrate-binding protein